MRNTASQLQTIAAFLRQETTLALATVDEQGEPCVTPLFYMVDADLTLYWLSSASSRHSLNLARSSSASVAVYRHAETWRQIRGLQMRGQVSAIAQRERRRALIEQYRQRFQLGAVLRLAISQCTLYAFRPESFRYLDNTKRFGYRLELLPSESDWQRFRAAAAEPPGQNSALPASRPASPEEEIKSDRFEN